MLKLPVKPPIVNENIDLSEYAKKSDVDAIGTSLGDKAEKKEVEKINSQLDTLTKKVDDEIKEIQSTTNTFKENINTSFNEFSNEQQNNFEALREEVLSDIEASYVGYDNEQHLNLESRLNSDFDKINQRVNDSSYLEYEGTSIKADNTYYGLTKEATVKGRTLQNIFDFRKVNGTNGLTHNNGEFSASIVSWDYYFKVSDIPLKPNTEYTVFIDYNKGTYTGTPEFRTSITNFILPSSTTVQMDKTGIYRYKSTTASEIDLSSSLIYFKGTAPSSTEGTFSFRVMILEGDHTNTPIEELPFVEGIQSVGENEVQEDGKYLISGKSCGKNLINHNKWSKSSGATINDNNDGSFTLTTTSPWSGIAFKDIKLKSNTTYTLNCKSSQSNIGMYVRVKKSNGNYNAQADWGGKLPAKFTTGNNAPIVQVTIETISALENVIISEIQLEENSIATAYEPYQESTYSYILDEPLTQLPNGVADSIDLETGVLTRRIGKIVLDGSEPTWRRSGLDWSSTDVWVYMISNENVKLNADLISDNFSTGYTKKTSVVEANDGECIESYFAGGEFRIAIKVSKLETNDITGFKKWLSENPTTVYYELAEPTTEQLTPIQLKSFEDTTHIMSNNTLQARTSVKIPSNVQAVVTNLINENEALRSNVDILNVENEGLKETNEVQDELIDINMMATDEVYTMIEPLLASQPMSMERGMSKLVDMYVAMVQRGLKTIDQVPIRYRAEVQAILEALEK